MSEDKKISEAEREDQSNQPTRNSEILNSIKDLSAVSVGSFFLSNLKDDGPEFAPLLEVTVIYADSTSKTALITMQDCAFLINSLAQGLATQFKIMNGANIKTFGDIKIKDLLGEHLNESMKSIDEIISEMK